MRVTYTAKSMQHWFIASNMEVVKPKLTLFACIGVRNWLDMYYSSYWYATLFSLLLGSVRGNLH